MSCCLPNKKILASVIPPTNLDMAPEPPTSTTVMTLSNTFNIINFNINTKSAAIVASSNNDTDQVPNNLPASLPTVKENGECGDTDSLSVSSDSSTEVAKVLQFSENPLYDAK
jgi:hypothetical protein